VGNVKFLQGNTGGQVGPDAGGIIMVPGSHGLNSAGNPGTNTVTFAINNAITLGDLSSIIGSPALICTTGDVTLSAGNVNLPSSNTSGNQGVITFGSARGIAFPDVTGGTTPVILIGSGAGNLNLGNSSRTIAIGSGAGAGLTGNQNTLIGFGSGPSIVSGGNNTFIGYSSGPNLNSTSSNNIFVGYNSGQGITGAQDANIFIGRGSSNLDGGTSNAISIGFTNAGASTQTACYIDGIFGHSVSGSLVAVDSNGKLGASSSSPVLQINGDSGSAAGVIITFTAQGTTKVGPTWAFTGSGSTQTLTSFDANSNIAIGGGNNSFAANSVTQCTILGVLAGASLTTSPLANTFIGYNSGASATSANFNTALGWGSLQSYTTSGSGADQNCALGQSALYQLTTGVRNIGVGAGSGTNYTTSESQNIVIGGAYGTATENNVTRIGYFLNATSQTACFIDGITGVTTGGAAVPVLVDGSGQLGVVSSSRLVKENIQSFDSSAILKAEPVKFNYIKQPGITTYGVIAEDLKEILPDLVVSDDAANMAIKSHEVVWFLLSELKKAIKRIEVLESKQGV
jgi:hypothetical protein